MRVKYNSYTFEPYMSVAGGTSNEWLSVLFSIFQYLYMNGAPIDLDTIETELYSSSTTSAGGAYMSARFIGEDTDPENYDVASLSLAIYASDYVYLEVSASGRNPRQDNYMYGNRIIIGSISNRSFDVTVHTIKSGNSFYFGFGFDSGDGCISTAITPMRSLSDPTKELGYGVISGIYYSYYGPSTPAVYRTLPEEAGYNYDKGQCTFIYAPPITIYPEVSSGKIPLVPLFTGIGDSYYEGVYLTPMRSGGQEEEAFETDAGIFLISNGYSMDYDEQKINWTELPFCQLAFDITESQNEGEN